MDEYDFSPPTPEELKAVESEYDFSPPSVEELKPAEEPSTASDALTGVGQGLTFGFLDELISAVKTPELYKAFWGLPSKEGAIKDTQEAVEKYRAQQQIEQEKVKQAKERSPIAFGAGEIAGGVLPALFTGGATAAATGAAKAGAAAAKTTSALLPALAEAAPAAGVATKEALGFLPSVLKGAKTGAAYGALAAAGTAEAPIEETGEFAKEVGKGALFGGTLGGGLSALGKIGRAIKPDVEESAIARQAKLAFEEAKGKAPVFGETATKLQRDRETKAAEELASFMLQGKETLGQEIKTVLEEAKLPLYSEDFSKIISTLGKEIPPDQRKFLVDYGQKLKEGTLTAVELNDLKNRLKDISFNYKDHLLPKSSEALKKLKERSEKLLETVPGYKEATTRYSEFLKTIPETFTEKGVPIGFRKRYLSDIESPENVLFNEVKNMIRTLQKPGTSADEYAKTFSALEKTISLAKEKDPEIFKKAGFSEKLFLESLKKEADLSAISQARRGYEPQTGLIRQFLNLLTPRGATYTGAAVAGKTVRAIEKSLPVKLASKVYSAAEPELRKASERLLANPLTKRFGENLAASLDKPGGVARRAVLFSIMQSPEARKTLSELYPGVGED